MRLEQLEVTGDSLYTVLYDAAYRSIQLIRQRSSLPRRTFIVVFSDGEDSGSTHSLEEVIDVGSGNALLPRVPVFTIVYTLSKGGLETLRTLSRETKGEPFHASSTDRLDAFFAEVWNQMTRSYLAAYPASMDGEAHEIEVRIGDLSERRSIQYPRMQSPMLPWLLGLAAAALVLGLLWLLVRRVRSAGHLVFADGSRSGETIRLRGPRLRVGALPDNDIVLDSRVVSRYHALIRVKGRKAEIEDLGSSNGTYVNGAPVRSVALRPGDKIRIGDVDLVYHR